MAENVKSPLGTLLVGFIGLLLGVILLIVLANTTDVITEGQTQVNESVVFASGVGSAGYSNLTSVWGVSNATADYSALITTAINWSTNGDLKVNSSFENATLLVSYNFEHPDFVSDSASRAFIGLTILFFAIFVFLMGYAIVRKTGLF